MLSCYCGLCGSGKTTYLVYLAKSLSKDIKNKKTTKKYILSNVDLKGIDYYYKIDFNDVGIFDFEDCYILIDEASIYMDSRGFKETKKSLLDFLALHRHYNCDIYAFFQCFGNVDKRYRTLSENVYIIKRCALFGKWFSKVYKIPYSMVIPDKGEKMGEIIEGYHMPNLIDRVLCKRLYRPRYYKYFDSFCKPLKLVSFDEFLKRYKYI